MFVLGVNIQDYRGILDRTLLDQKRSPRCQNNVPMNVSGHMDSNYVKKTVKMLLPMTFFALLSTGSYVFAQNEGDKSDHNAGIEHRCGNDPANAEMAIGRLKWAYKCKLITELQYGAGFHSPVPLYPTFVGSPRLPFEADASCPPPNENPPQLFGFCPGNGCFDINQRILVDFEHEANLNEILKGHVKNVISLGPATTQEKMTLAKQSIDKIIKGPESRPLTVLHMSNGTFLKLSYNHVLFLSSGQAIESQFARENMLLLGLDENIKIEKITYETTDEDVWNIQPIDSHPLSNTIISGGVVTGGFAYQNGMSDRVLREIFRLESIK